MRHLFNVVMRIVSSLFGLFMIVSGSTWMMQGLGIGPSVIMRGFMVNDVHWTFYGAIFTLLGVGQVVWSNTRQSAG
jgi:ABC-type lipoprotein release transport system permease subunit